MKSTKSIINTIRQVPVLETNIGVSQMKKYFSNRFAIPLYDRIKGSSINSYLKLYRSFQTKSIEEIEKNPTAHYPH